MKYIDLFAGAGGLSLGLHKAGLTGVFAVERNKDAFETLKYNLIDKKSHFEWPEWLDQKNWDILELLEKHSLELSNLKGNVDLVVGGPPCQGFSMAGKRQNNDVRNQLMHSYIEIVRLVQPKFLFFENVQGFTVDFKGEDTLKNYSNILLDELKNLGYKVECQIITMSEFGVPQNRKRFILFASKDKLRKPVKIKEKIIEGAKPARQDMLFHELGKVSRELNGTLRKMIRLMDENEQEKFSEPIYKIRRTSDKLSSIKKQILRINFETYSKLETIEIKSYLQSYIENTFEDASKVKLVLGSGTVKQKINIYDFGTLIDNLLINAQDRRAKNIVFHFEEDNTAMHIISDTGPIEIKPVNDIFKLGVTSKRRGTGLGMYICQQICSDFGWTISVSEIENDFVDFKIEFRKE